jgi:hypothetical protein
MVTPISEAEARAALLRAGSEASNPEYFDAERREHGWVFGWREDRGAVPMGTHTWVVADNGRIRMLSYKDLWDDAIAEELAK